MANVRIGKGTITNTLADIDTAAVPASNTRAVKAITLCNTSTSNCWVTVTFAGTTVLSEYIIPAKTGENTITIPFIDQVMVAGERIQAQAQTNGVIHYYISGIEKAV